jgi:hypothetical protein
LVDGPSEAITAIVVLVRGEHGGGVVLVVIYLHVIAHHLPVMDHERQWFDLLDHGHNHNSFAANASVGRRGYFRPGRVDALVSFSCW